MSTMSFKHLLSRPILPLPLRSLQTHSHRNFSIIGRLQKTDGQVISEVAREEGGPSKGSASAQLQSQVTKERNRQQGNGGASSTPIPKPSSINSLDPTQQSQVISEVAREEGGTSKGSTSAQLQSQVTKERNRQQGNAGASSTLAQNPSSQGSSSINSLNPTQQSQVISEVAREEAGTSKGSASAQLQSQVTKERNRQQGNAGVGSTPAQNPTSINSSNRAGQSQSVGDANYSEYAEVASKVQDKIATDPTSVTPEEANLARSRETRAFGSTEKGGVAATAQSLASENERRGSV